MLGVKKWESASSCFSTVPAPHWELATAFAQLTDMGSKKKRNCNWEYLLVPSGHPQGGGGGAASAPEGTEGPALGKKRQAYSETFSFAGSKEDVIKLQNIKISSSAES